MDEQRVPPHPEHEWRHDPWAPPEAATVQQRGQWPGRMRTASRVAGRLVLLAALGLTAVMLFDVTNGFGTQASSTPSGTGPTGRTGPTVPPDSAQQTAEAFFTAWQHNDLTRAAQMTDDPSDAYTTLSAYRTALDLSSLNVSIQRVTPQGTVLYSITAGVELPEAETEAEASAATTASPEAATGHALTGTWTYSDYLTSYPVDGVWLIKWDPNLVAPNLTATETLALLPVPPPAGRTKGTPGLEVVLMAPDRTPLPKTADVIRQPT